jgi:hypothetical protein
MTTFEQARDDILTLFKTAWDTTTYPAVYEDTKGDRPASDTPFARPRIRHTTGGQASLSGGLGTSRFERIGFLLVAIYTPQGSGLTNAYSLAKIVADAFEGTASPNGVWFRNVRINEIGPDGDFFVTNVVVDFVYDEVK